jgi:hypothetical protein
MPGNDKWEAILKQFRRQDLDSILEHRESKIVAANRDELIEEMIKKSPDICKSLSEAHKMLRGVPPQGIIQEIFLLENELGADVKDCLSKPQIIAKLFLEDRLDVLERVADYARYVKKRQISPLIFAGRLKESVIQTTLRETVEEIIENLNPHRPKVLVFQDAAYSPDNQIVRVAVSREIGRRHVVQRPERALLPEMIEQDIFPLRPHVIEVDLKRNRLKTTFGKHDRDGLNVTQSILEGFMDLSEKPRQVEFRSNALDSVTIDETHRAIDESILELPKDSPIHQTLTSVKEARKVVLSVKGLNIAGDLRKLEVHAGDVDQVVGILGIDSSLLEGAKNANYEIELPDGRRIRVYSHNLTFVGEFSKDERTALEEVFLK